MKLLLKILLPVLVVLGSVFAAKTVLDNRPEPFKRPQFPSSQAVDATTLTPTDYAVQVRSQGTIQATQTTTLVSEVNGTVNTISPVFVIGGTFKQGDVLLEIDDRDYVIALTQAEANLAQANAALQEETARGKLAKSDWDSLGNGRKASAFTLRQPQLAASRANRAAASAQVERAQLDLTRTRIIAPYDGYVQEMQVDLGQFVSRGTPIGKIYSEASVDVRLPLSSRQVAFLDIPASSATIEDDAPTVILSATSGDASQSWQGTLIRAEGVDAGTQQLNVIARVQEPFVAGKPQLRVGQYVEASVQGRTLEDVFVLPRAALREDREVLLVNEESQLERREVTVLWSDETTAVIKDGLAAGMVLVTTPLSTVTNGTPVRATVDGVAPPPLRRGGPQSGGGGRPDGQGNRGQGGQRPEGQRQRGQGEGGQRPEGQGRGGQREAGQRPQASQQSNQPGEQSQANGEQQQGGQNQAQQVNSQSRRGQNVNAQRPSGRSNPNAGTVARDRVADDS